MNKYYLPLVANGIYTTTEGIKMPVRAMEFARAWMELLGEREEWLILDARLCNAAQRQADWLSVHDFVPGHPHEGEWGNNANQRVLDAGYPLPDWYTLDKNFVESVTRDWGTPEQAAIGLANDTLHFDHMHFEGWFSAHTRWGVGNAETYYVCMTAP